MVLIRRLLITEANIGILENNLALRGISSPAQLQKVLVTPLTPGSFGLPE